MQVHLETAKRSKDLLRLNCELERSNTALNAFAAVAAHDLKSPLNTIQISADVLSQHFGEVLGAQGAKLLKGLSKSVVRLARMIDGLLELSRIGSNDLNCETFSLSDILSEVQADLSQAIGETKAEIVIEKNPRIYGSKDLLRRLFQNLVANALKYQPVNSVPRIVVSQTNPKEESSVVIEVQDNGIGFPPEKSEEIFRLFSRLVGSGEYEGSGIGLATCQRIVDEHQGKIWAESSPGKGASFFVSLPNR
jgi:light-regulated signal transduction histidine kinase (bacteriophytochrome)